MFAMKVVKPYFDTQFSGLFLFNKDDNENTESNNQSRALINLKVHCGNHLSNNKLHKQKKDDKLRKESCYMEAQSRQERIGLCLFRTMY